MQLAKARLTPSVQQKNEGRSAAGSRTAARCEGTVCEQAMAVGAGRWLAGGGGQLGGQHRFVVRGVALFSSAGPGVFVNSKQHGAGWALHSRRKKFGRSPERARRGGHDGKRVDLTEGRCSGAAFAALAITAASAATAAAAVAAHSRPTMAGATDLKEAGCTLLRRAAPSCT